MKICVYAIARNESDNVAEWTDSVREADEVYVLVNNSNDNTADLLRKNGVSVEETVLYPFRFDTARNRNLAMVPEDTDVCVCLDLDERPSKGWRMALEEDMKNNDLMYYNVKVGENCLFPSGKIHTRDNFKWVHACHEYLEWTGEGEPTKEVSDIIVTHKQDMSKKRDYLPLLEIDTQEDSDNPRVWHYLGREYMMAGQYEKAIETFVKHLKIADWIEERCASMRFISRCFYRMGNKHQAKLWLFHSCGECEVREPYIDMAWLLSQEQDWAGVKYFAGRALSITNRGSYPSEQSAWGTLPQELYDMSFKEE